MWDTYSLTGLKPVEGAGGGTVTSQMAVAEHGAAGVLSPSNPLFWFGTILAVTVGAVAVSGSVKLGGAKFSAGVGK